MGHIGAGLRVTVGVTASYSVRDRREVEVSDPRIELGDGVCDLEKVPPDQIDPSAKRG